MLTQYFWPENFNISDLAYGLHERGYEVDVLTGMPNYPDGRFFSGYEGQRVREEKYKGLKVIRVPLVSRGKTKTQLVLNYMSFPLSSVLFGLNRLNGKYDAVFVYAPSPMTIGVAGLFFKRRLNCPLLIWVQDLWPESLTAAGGINAPLVLRVVKYMVRRIYQSSDLVLVPSIAFGAAVTEAGADPQRVRYIPNSVEYAYKPEQKNCFSISNSGMPKDGFRIVYAGNFGEAQGLDVVLRAASLIEDSSRIRWILIGSGRSEAKLKKMHNDLGLGENVYFLNRVSNKFISRYIDEADALFLSLNCSGVFKLTVPTKMQFYMSCGKPMLGSISGEGARLIEESKSGFSTCAGDAESLAEAALRLSRLTPRQRQMMGTSARAYFEAHFTRARILDLLEGCVNEARVAG